ncbi:rhomboid family intramembrane serine protease [Ignavibacteriales bacterium]
MSNGNYRPAGFSYISPVIKSLLIANVAVFFLEMMLSGINSGGTPLGYFFTSIFALFPLGDGFGPWQLFSYQFMHADFGHIFFNLFALWMFGTEVEYTLGSKKFLIFYLASGVGAGLLHLLTPLFGITPGPTIGASGSLYGVMIAFALFNPDRYIYIYFLLPVKAKYLIGFMILLDLFMFRSPGSNVAHLAHIGGAITGFLFLFFDKSVFFSLKRKLKGGGGSGYQGYSNRYDDDDDGPSIYSDRTSSTKSGFNFSFKTKKSSDQVVDAKFKDVSDSEISQEEIDKILDKISVSGYTNLTSKEKDLLFEVSKRMRKKE